MSESAATQDLFTLLVFWIAIYVCSWLAERTHLSPLLFYLVVGSVLGNLSKIDGLHIIHNTPAIHLVSELAITLVFLALGFEENVDNFMNGIKKAWGIASIGALVPFCCGLSTSLAFFPDMDIKAHLMVGLAVTATAVSLTMISLKSEGLALSRAAIGIMTSAVLDDVACLALVAIMVPIASGQAEPTAGGISWVVGKSLIFFFIITVLNMFILPTITTQTDVTNHPFLSYIPGLRSIGVSPFIKFLHGEQATLATLIIGLSIGLFATAFGFHPAIGAYMAGLIIEERYFDIDPLIDEDEADDPSDLETAIPPDPDEPPPNVYGFVKDVLESVAFGWIGPIFFLNLGSQIIVKADILVKVLPSMFAFFVALFVGQILSAALAARFVPGGFTWAESWMIGFGMLGRAELFFVVLNLSYMEYHIITEEVFFSLTMAAMMLNIAVPITISLYKPYYVRNQASALQPEKQPVPRNLYNELHKKAFKDKVSLDRRTFRPAADPVADAITIRRIRANSQGSQGSGTSQDFWNKASVNTKASTFSARLSSKASPARMLAKHQMRNSDIDFFTSPPNRPHPDLPEQPPAPLAAWGHSATSSSVASSK